MTTKKKSIAVNLFFWFCIIETEMFVSPKVKNQSSGVFFWVFFSLRPFVVDTNLQKSWFNSEVLVLNFDFTPTF